MKVIFFGKLTGAEFRYIRAALLLSQKSLGQLFGYSEQAVAKWEKLGKVPKIVDAALRLIFIERHGGSKEKYRNGGTAQHHRPHGKLPHHHHGSQVEMDLAD